MSTLISPEKKALDEILGVKDKRYTVPLFQRGFSWDRDEHIQNLWDDLIGSLGKKYFLGTIILYEDRGEKGVYKIIDGQQRLASLIMLLSVIRDWLDENGHEKTATKINDNFICDTGYFEEGPAEFKLTLNYEDDKFFNRVVALPKDSEDRVNDKVAINELQRTESNKYIRDAYDFYVDVVEDYARKTKRGSVNRTQALFDHIAKDLIFIVIEVESFESSFEIFETLNDRGKALAAGDLVKVFLCEKLWDELSTRTRDFDRIKDNIIKPWFEILENLNIEDPKIDKFLRHWLMSETSKELTVKSVYKEFKERYLNRRASSTLNRLLEISKAYSYLIGQNTHKNDEVEKYLGWLRILRAERCYPLLIKGFSSDLNAPDLKRILRAIEILTVRWTTVCNFSGKDLERLYLKLLKSLSRDNVRQIIQELNLKNPDDVQFAHSFNRLYSTQSKRNQIKYLLWRIEMKINPKVDIQPYEVNLEHILPQNPGGEKYWEKVTGKLSNPNNKSKFEEHLNLLGNLTLLGEKLNEKAKRKGFDEKREIYKSSGLELNKKVIRMVRRNGVWDYRKIIKRQEELTKIAKQIWPRR